MLKDPKAAESIDRKGDTWTPDVPADRPRAYAAYGCSPRTYDEGESVAVEYDVWDDYRSKGYMTPGRYRFETRVSVAEAGSDFGGDALAQFAWGFELAVGFAEES